MKLVLTVYDDNGRQVQAFELGELMVNPAAGEVKLVRPENGPGPTEAPGRDLAAQEAILDVLSTWPAKPAAIVECTGLRLDVVYLTLWRLEREGLVVKTQFGDYDLASNCREERRPTGPPGGGPGSTGAPGLQRRENCAKQ